jgi:hypothetical protein
LVLVRYPTTWRRVRDAIRWTSGSSSSFDMEQFRAGMEVEFEHGARDPRPT